LYEIILHALQLKYIKTLLKIKMLHLKKQMKHSKYYDTILADAFKQSQYSPLKVIT
jgi:hypothetical protein